MLSTRIVNDLQKGTEYLLYTPILDGLPFKVNGSGHFLSGKDYLVERDNLMDMYLLLYTVSGSGKIRYRGSDLLLNPGQCILINGEEYHRYSTNQVDNQIWDFKWIRFSSGHAADFDRLITDMEAKVVYVAGTSYEKYNDHIISLMKERKSSNELLMSSYCDNMLTIMHTRIQSSIRNIGEGYSRMEEARSYILSHYDENMNVSELAERAYMTDSAFIRKFRKLYSLTPYQFLQKTRMDNAALLLETTELTVQEICSNVGFTDQNNFSKQFRLHFRQSPTSYRMYYSAGPGEKDQN